MGKESRFVDIEQHIRLLKCVPGPGHYVPRTQLLDRVSNSPCKIIQKPYLKNENHYEVIGGTAQVLSPALMESRKSTK